jgi:enoyl-CoA hydratase/carnithine racemase
MAKTNPAAPVRVIEETPAYWRVVFEYPPFNIVDATMFEGLQNLLVRMDTRQSLRVVVFESANPDFYLAHFDLTGKTGNITTAVGPSGLQLHEVASAMRCDGRPGQTGNRDNPIDVQGVIA